MRRIRLVKLNLEGNEHDVAIVPLDADQSKALADTFNGWPTAVVHPTGVYLIEDWDNTEAVYVFSTHVSVNGEGFTIPITGKPPQTQPST